MKIDVKILNNLATLPTRGSVEAAGYDLYAVVNNENQLDQYVSIPPHTTVKIPTGIAVSIPTGYFGGVYARSGLATKKGLALANKVGIVDAR